MVVAVKRDGVWACAFTHAVQLQQWDVQAHEVLQSVFGDRGSTSEETLAAVEAQRSTHLLEDQIVCQHEAPGHLILPITQQSTLT